MLAHRANTHPCGALELEKTAGRSRNNQAFEIKNTVQLILIPLPHPSANPREASKQFRLILFIVSVSLPLALIRLTFLPYDAAKIFSSKSLRVNCKLEDFTVPNGEKHLIYI